MYPLRLCELDIYCLPRAGLQCHYGTSTSVSRLLSLFHTHLFCSSVRNKHLPQAFGIRRPLPLDLPIKSYTDHSTCSWYAVYNVYQVHQFVYSWAAALNVTSSQKAITNAVNPRIPNTATTVMVTLINKYGLNKNADAALIKMLQVPTQTPQPTFDNFRVRGESSTPSAAKWQVLLVARLQDTLAVVMDDFDAFLGAVGNGTFSTRGLATASDLKAKLKEASASKVASASSHKSTASSHASSHTAATGPSSSQMVTTQSTVSTRSPVSTMATVSAHRPVGESTGP